MLRDPQESVGLLLQYAAELRRWNVAFNLIARGDVQRLAERHLVDGLRVVPAVRPGRLLDIGSGAGLPGLVIAIVAPKLAVTLLERTARRARFLEHMVRTLGLRNVQVAHADALDWRDTAGFATVTARAVASGAVLAALVRPHLAPDGVLVAQLGAQQDQHHLPPGFHVLDSRDYQLPGAPTVYRLVVLAPCEGASADG